MTTTRRSFLATAAGVGAAWGITDWARVSEALAYAAQAVTQRPAPPFVALTADEAAQVATIAERIMPTTDTPGAREAGVIFFIDRALATSEKDALPDIRKGLVDLARRTARRKPGTRRFTELSPADQDAVLAEMEKEDFFRALHFLTMVGMFADPRHGGNRDRVGWKIIGFDHQPTYAPPFGYYDAEAAKGR